MSVRIGHASADENGRAHGGKAGDQTGREVCTRRWYNGGWNVVLRPKSAAAAEKMARFCEQTCANDNVGYDQYQRNTLRAAAESAGWDAARIAAPCETDCSAFMTVCAEAAGISVAYTKTASGENAPVTGNMRKRFFDTGAFAVLLDARYTDSDKYLRRGDVLVRESGHTAMALSDGALSGSSLSGGEAETNQEEENMTGEQIYTRLNEYLAKQPAPDWAKDELAEAVKLGVTDGTRPMQLIPRYQAAIMAKRAVEAAVRGVR